MSYSAAPNCQLDITMLTAAGTIGPNQRLIIRYRTQLDANTQNGVDAHQYRWRHPVVQWQTATIPTAKSSTGTLTNGTPGILDNQDALTVTVALTGYVFDKTVADLTSGANPATTAAPGDKLRYTLRFRTTSQALNNFSIVDDMDALNAQADFVPGTLTLVTSPPGADVSATSSTGGTKGTGVIDIRNLSLPANGELLIQFDIMLKSAVANGTVVTNQATLVSPMARPSPGAMTRTSTVRRSDAGDDRVSSVFRVQKLFDSARMLLSPATSSLVTVKNISNAGLWRCGPRHRDDLTGPIGDAARVARITAERTNSPATRLRPATADVPVRDHPPRSNEGSVSRTSHELVTVAGNDPTRYRHRRRRIPIDPVGTNVRIASDGCHVR